MMFKATSPVLALAVVIAVIYGVVVTKERDALNTKLESVQSALASTRADLSSTKQILISIQSELSSTKQTLASTQGELSSTTQKLSSVQNDLLATKTRLDAIDAKLKLYEDTMGIKIFSSVQPGIQRGDLSIMHLNNVTTATNPSWQQLISFVLADPTDDKYYSVNSFDCVDFTEMLHNNAEAAGIKSAFVVVRFKNDPVGHALNAFTTTDRGLVYVDNTGGEFFIASLERDKIAYLTKGKELGFISLGSNTPINYASYEKIKADWNSYNEKLKLYNIEVGMYNLEISGKVYYIGTIEWQRISTWWATLEAQGRALDALRAQLEDIWIPMGIVDNIEIYW